MFDIENHIDNKIENNLIYNNIMIKLCIELCYKNTKYKTMIAKTFNNIYKIFAHIYSKLINNDVKATIYQTELNELFNDLIDITSIKKFIKIPDFTPLNI